MGCTGEPLKLGSTSGIVGFDSVDAVGACLLFSTHIKKGGQWIYLLTHSLKSISLTLSAISFFDTLLCFDSLEVEQHESNGPQQDDSAAFSSDFPLEGPQQSASSPLSL